MQSFLQFVIIGLGAGATYALFAQGAVLIYRGSGLVNFAQGALGTLAAYVAFAELKAEHSFKTLPAGVAGVIAAVLVSLLFQRLVLRALRNAAAIVRVIATVGLLGLVQALVAKRYSSANVPVDQFLPHDVWTWGDVRVQEERVYLVAISLLVTVGLWAWTRYTRTGLAISASAENERAVQTLGWSPDRLAALTWGLGGGLAGLAAVLVAPLTGLSGLTMTMVVTVAGLAAALLGGFRSFPLTFVGGLIVGLGESLATRYSSDVERWLHQDQITGLNRATGFLVILIVLVVRGRGLPLRSHVAERLPRLGTGQVNVPGLVIGSAVLLGLLFTVFDDSWAQATYVSLAAGVMILSIVVLTGYAGQLSLAQWALGGIGALIAARLVKAGVAVELAIPVGIVLTVLIGALFALPALRTRGVNLAVVTLGLGFTVSEVVFANNQYVAGGLEGGTPIGRIELFGIEVDAFGHPHRWALVSLVAFVAIGVVVANLRRSRTGRRLIAVRTNERAAASLGISVVGVKLYAFAVAAGIAAVAGILTAFQFQNVQYGQFNVFASINAVGYAVIGGLGYALGAVFAAPNAVGGLGTKLLEDVVDLGDWAEVVGAVLVIVILIVHQNGIADLVTHAVRPLADRLRGATPARPADLPEVVVEAVAARDPVGGGAHRPVRQRARRPRRVVRGAPGRGRRPHRTQRRRQDHGHRRRHRLRETGGGHDRLRRPADPASQRHRAGPTWGCAGRSSRSSCSRTSTSRPTSGPGPSRACPRRRGRATSSGRAGTPSAPPRSPPSAASTCRATSARCPRSCPTGGGAWSASPAPWRPGRRSCCSTSRRRGSTRPRAASSPASSGGWPTSGAWASCWSSTTCRW